MDDLKAADSPTRRGFRDVSSLTRAFLHSPEKIKL
jgi:hypothetical protein